MDQLTLSANIKPVHSQKRQSPRYPFVNTAHFHDFRESGMKARVADLSRGGCYLDTANPLPVGAEIRLSITRNGETLEAYATVVYVVPNLGMGVAFTHLASGAGKTLDKWIASAKKS